MVELKEVSGDSECLDGACFRNNVIKKCVRGTLATGAHLSETLEDVSNCKELLISVSFQLLCVNGSSYFCVELGPTDPLDWCVDVQGVFVCEEQTGVV